MTPPAEWITPKEAADMLGISATYFRQIYCQTESPLLRFRERRGPRGGRRMFVSRTSVLMLIEDETRTPA